MRFRADIFALAFLGLAFLIGFALVIGGLVADDLNQAGGAFFLLVVLTIFLHLATRPDPDDPR
ncbi:MAG: hypothetical protein ACRDPE_15325 [Solirubrobacterales bacterium]